MLKFEKISLRSAKVGEDSFIPDIIAGDGIPFFKCDDTVEPEEAKKIGTGIIASVLPYKMQNNYTRDITEMEYNAAILEDENYKAIFLPELGGRLWSLYDKKLDKELLYVNDSVKYANIALCNAWFAGGVEWNIGIKGHSPYTSRPLFAKKVKAKDGADILRMYEYEEIRGLCYAVEARLTEKGLAVHITADNIKDEPTLMYWWSNIAVPQTRDTKVYVPTGKTFVTSYQDGGYIISKKNYPIHEGVDLSDTYTAEVATDYFYDIPAENPKWICAVEADNIGLLHHTGHILKGRKTFIWGQANGGHHWNEWLTENNRDYLEIQAGLCKTQFEHFEIPAKAHLEWTELYSGVSLDATGYDERVSEINAGLPEIDNLDSLFLEAEAEKPLIFGCGRGYLEQKLTRNNFPQRYDFPLESLSDREEYYLSLLNGNFTKNCVMDENTEFVYNEKWIDVILKKDEITAFDNYMVGLIYFEHDNMEKAREHFEKSLAMEKTFYVLAAHAKLLSSIFKEHAKAYELMKESLKLRPNDKLLFILAGEIAIRAEDYRDFIELYDNASDYIRNAGRIRMYVGQCYVALNELETAKEYINKDLYLPDIKEGEYSISSIWTTLYKKEMAKLQNINEEDLSDSEVLAAHPFPKEIDFRTH